MSVCVRGFSNEDLNVFFLGKNYRLGVRLKWDEGVSVFG